MKVPSIFCQALGGSHLAAAREPGCQRIVESWQQIEKTLSALPNLTSVDVWIDHTSPEKWATFDERSVVEPFAAFARNRSDIRATVHLPWLHPLHENPRLHFSGPKNTESICVKRFIRQRRFARASPGGRDDYPRFDEVEDFPYLASHSEWWRFPTYKDLIEAERVLWRQGVDVKAGKELFDEELRDISGVYHGNDPPLPRAFQGRLVWNEFYDQYNRLSEALKELSEESGFA
ncbi:hypothetical protein MN608_06637 [Microdochium nivale]|nr:hypothetical protein MN608_06637 [Microdochium nivale]